MAVKLRAWGHNTFVPVGFACVVLMVSWLQTGWWGKTSSGRFGLPSPCGGGGVTPWQAAWWSVCFRRPFSALAFSHDGKHLVTGEVRAQIHLPMSVRQHSADWKSVCFTSLNLTQQIYTTECLQLSSSRLPCLIIQHQVSRHKSRSSIRVALTKKEERRLHLRHHLWNSLSVSSSPHGEAAYRCDGVCVSERSHALRAGVGGGRSSGGWSPVSQIWRFLCGLLHQQLLHRLCGVPTRHDC